MSEIENSYLQCLKEIPVAINTSYGDAFQPSQWADSLKKLHTLVSCGHKGPVMFGSKYIITDAQLEDIAGIHQDVWLFIAITGLHESKLFSMEEYEEYYLRACKRIKNVVCAIRPIIPQKNDNIETLLPIIHMVGKGRKMLTYSGYRDPQILGSPKYRNELLFNLIQQACKDHSILCKEKCACMVSAVNKTDCWIHGKTAPMHLDLIKALGYKFYMEDEQLILTGYKDNHYMTKGDISFLRMISKSPFISGNISSPSEIISVRIDDHPLVCTSSWFNWAQQTYCAIECDYCFAAYKSKTRIDLENFGCNPTDLMKVLEK